MTVFRELVPPIKQIQIVISCALRKILLCYLRNDSKRSSICVSAIRSTYESMALIGNVYESKDIY